MLLLGTAYSQNVLRLQFASAEEHQLVFRGDVWNRIPLLDGSALHGGQEERHRAARPRSHRD